MKKQPLGEVSDVLDELLTKAKDEDITFYIVLPHGDNRQRGIIKRKLTSKSTKSDSTLYYSAPNGESKSIALGSGGGYGYFFINFWHAYAFAAKHNIPLIINEAPY